MRLKILLLKTMRKLETLTIAVLIGTMLPGCGGDITESVNDFAGRTGADTPNQQLEINREMLDLSAPARNPERNAYFGDLHVHT